MTKSPAGPRKANRATPADKTRAVAKVPNAPKAVTKPAKAANTPKTAPAARRKAKGAAEEFPIVGIGASAGGLEAIEQFLAKTPAGSGMAYVVVQHLDPSRKGMMPELLQRVTRMKVEQAADSVKVEPDHVYVIPPNMDMALQQGVLHLFEFEEPRAQRLPIDFFLRSLAADRRRLDRAHAAAAQSVRWQLARRRGEVESNGLDRDAMRLKFVGDLREFAGAARN